jgi:hypothetical protein
MRGGLSTVNDFFSLKDRMSCVYPSTKNWNVQINSNGMPGLGIKSIDRINGKVFLTSTAGANYKKTTTFTFSDGTSSVTCPLIIEVYSCDLKCRYTSVNAPT